MDVIWVILRSMQTWPSYGGIGAEGVDNDSNFALWTVTKCAKAALGWLNCAMHNGLTWRCGGLLSSDDLFFV